MNQLTKAAKDREPRHTGLRYALLTTALFLPLILSFIFIRDRYPFAASKMMLGAVDMPGQNYYVLRGETVTGQTVDLPPINLTNALTGRSWSLVRTAVENSSFKIRSPHPANISLAAFQGGLDKVPRAARLEDLLRAWGSIYNSRLAADSSQRLKLVRLDSYRWDGAVNGAYDRFVESWTVRLDTP